jgi:hypothetical protein
LRQGLTHAGRGLRERAVVLVLVIIIVIAAVVVYAIRAVKPKRVKLRAGLGKFTLLDFEADAGSQAEPDAISPVDPKERPPGGQHRRPA